MARTRGTTRGPNTDRLAVQLADPTRTQDGPTRGLRTDPTRGPNTDPTRGLWADFGGLWRTQLGTYRGTRYAVRGTVRVRLDFGFRRTGPVQSPARSGSTKYREFGSVPSLWGTFIGIFRPIGPFT